MTFLFVCRFDFLSSSKLFRKSTLTKLILSALRVRVCEKERDIERERERESCSCLAQKASLFFSLFKEEEEEE
jgi:hypothetical protein